ncbi:MAG: SPOR domain-containing protein [Caulobacteraceae bacterium]
MISRTAGILIFVCGAWTLGAAAPLAPPSAAPPAPDEAVPREEMIRRMVAWTGLPARTIIGFGDGVAVAIVGGQAGGGHGGVTKGISLRAEVVGEAAAASLGWRSMRSTVDIDCDHRRDLVTAMEVFADHDLKGVSKRPALPGVWGEPDRLAYLGGVISALCGNRVVASGASSPAVSPRPLRIDKGSRGPPTIVSVPATARPTVTAKAATPTAPSVASAAVQIAAVSHEAAARRALARLETPAMAGLTRRVDTVRKNGQMIYRAVVAGFASRAEARSFCASLRKAGQDCLVR